MQTFLKPLIYKALKRLACDYITYGIYYI